jgi:hypothetical protein
VPTIRQNISARKFRREPSKAARPACHRVAGKGLAVARQATQRLGALLRHLHGARPALARRLGIARQRGQLAARLHQLATARRRAP